MANRKKAETPTATATAERARAATERARARLDEQEGVETKVDILRVPLSWWRERWADQAIRRQFIENFIHVRDERDQKKLVLLKFNDMQDDYWRKRTGKDVKLKMRKGGSSMQELAIKFANCVVLPGRTFLCAAHNPKTTAKFRRDLRTMYRKLPAHLKPETAQFNGAAIEFQDAEKGTVDSVITTFTVQPGFEEESRGDTITDLLISEMPFMRGDTKTAVTAMLEACAPNADITNESTAGGIEHFHSIYQDGKKKRGGWMAHFYEWFWRRSCRVEGAMVEHRGDGWFVVDPREPNAPRNETPVTRAERKVCGRILLHLINRGYAVRGTKWYAPEVAEYLAWRRAKIEERGEQTFLVEYPENDKDCFEQTGRPVVRADYLKVTCEPQEPLEGRMYLVAVDTSAGTERGNPAAIEVIDIFSGAQVFEETLKLAPDLLAYRVAQVSDHYNGAYIVPERNNTGYATVRKLVELGYGDSDRLYKHIDAPTQRALDAGKITFDEAMEKSQHGFPTDSINKPLAGLALEEAIRTGELGLCSQAFCDQALTVVWKDDGSFSAISGYEDDLFMALAIGNFVRRTRMGNYTGFVGVMPETGYAR
jgi:hypothetical protein